MHILHPSHLRRQLAFGAALAVAMLATLAGLRPASAQGPDMPEADQKALGSYTLTLEKLDKLEAVTKKLIAATKADPQISKEMQAIDAEKGGTFAGANEMFAKDAPKVTALLKAEGLEPREYLLGLLSTMFATMGASMKGSAGAALPGFIPAANIELAEKNQARFETVAKSMADLDAASKPAAE